MNFPAKKDGQKSIPAAVPYAKRRRRANLLAAEQPAEYRASPAPASTHGAPSAFTGDTAEIIKTMRRGTPARYIADLAQRFGISQDRLFETLRLPKSTLKGRIGKNELLSPSEQDRVYRADKVWTRALEVLEDEPAARLWINRDNRSLGGEAPLSLLDTEAGYELVLDTLGRIEYGVVS